MIEENPTSPENPNQESAPEPTLAEKMAEAAASQPEPTQDDAPPAEPEAQAEEKPEKAQKRGDDGKFASKNPPPPVIPTENQPAAPEEKPKYQADFKYKAFGKEKELDPFFRDLVKDPESEKKVKDVFTRADAFDDMKQRYETSTVEAQKTLTQFQALDRDVKRVMEYRNSGDYDNFFRSLQISDDDLFRHLQHKAEIAKLPPEQQAAYNQGIEARAQSIQQQEQYTQMQQNFAKAQAEARQMQLDMVLMRPEVTGTANAFDGKMGQGAFRQLVIDEAYKHHMTQGQDMSASDAVAYVLNKFGKLLEGQTAPQAQAVVQSAAPAPQPQAQPQASQAPGTVVVQGKPVIPNVNGRGTSPVKQAPKSLSDLRKMGQAIRNAESAGHVANT